MLAVEATSVVAQVADVPRVAAFAQQLALAGRDERKVVQVDALLAAAVRLTVSGRAARDEVAEVAAELVAADVVLGALRFGSGHGQPRVSAVAGGVRHDLGGVRGATLLRRGGRAGTGCGCELNCRSNKEGGR